MSRIKKWSQVTGAAVRGLSIAKPFPYLWKHAYLCTFGGERGIENTRLILQATAFIYLRNNIDYAYVAIYKDHVVICFQGTGRNVRAWISNFDAYPLKKDAYRGTYLKDGPWGKGCIHDGFYTGWSFFKPAIDKLLKSYNIDPQKTPIFITGHSRGGALGELCARHLAKNRGIPCSIITFGSPAPGTKVYRDQFRLLPINGTWVRNKWDIVTFMPPPAFGFKHGCANRVWLNRKRKISKLIPGSRIRAHYYTSYDKQVMKRAS